MPLPRRLWIPALLGLLAALAGCADTNGARRNGATPIVLSYPYLTPREARVPGYRELAERTAGTYVRLAVLSPGGGLYDEKPGVIQRASGVLVDTEGHIVTVAHVLRNIDYPVEVTTRDGRRHMARIVDISPRRELALLKMRPFPGIQAARFADSDRVRPGDFALAIGSPHQGAGVVTLGWVRVPKIGKRLESNPSGPWSFRDGIELKMEVEIGHSGGPIFNRAGKLIGLVAANAQGDITKTPYVSPRITFAVPSNAVAAYVKEVLGR